MQKWRLIKTIIGSGKMQMAIDEAMMFARSKRIVPNTLRFYKWSPACVSIGFFQNINEEVDILKCDDLGIDYVRRYTGGGAVFHENEVTYSIVLSEEDVPKDIVHSYRLICGALVKGFEKLGVKAEFKAINDIEVNGKKISGNAQTRKNGIVLQHGTILLDVNVDKMFSLLKVPDEKIRDKIIQNVKERLTSLEGKFDFNKVKKTMISAFQETFKIKFKEEKLTEKEEELAKKLYKEKYSTIEWNNGR